MSILVLAEHHDGALACATAHVVSAAKQIVKESGGDIDVLVAGEGVAAIAEAAAITGSLEVRRLKKQKLALKDAIAKIEDQLLPDIIA